MTDLEINNLQRRMDSFQEVQREMKDGQKEIKDDIKEIKNSVTDLPTTFITRREYEAAQTAGKSSNWMRQMVITLLMCVASIAIAIYKLR